MGNRGYVANLVFQRAVREQNEARVKAGNKPFGPDEVIYLSYEVRQQYDLALLLVGYRG